MLNILPTEEKKRIISEYRFRVGIVAVFAIALLILASLVLLGPSYLLAVNKYNDISEQLVRQQQRLDIGSSNKEIDKIIIEINKKINLFLTGGVANRISPPDVISKIIGLKSPEIRIEGFDYDGSGRQERLVIMGTAANRDGLANFVDILRKDPTFVAVDLPVSSYVKSADIKFSIVVTRGSVVEPPK